MKSSDHIIALLYDRGDRWWSMAELASAANLGEVRLDRVLTELAQRGHRMEFSPAMGIRLCPATALDAFLIERDLGTQRIGRHVICFPVVDSTNDTAADGARQRRSDGLAVLAETQRKGRGRHGRRWLSPPGEKKNILMSVLLKDTPEKLPVEAMTIATGLAVAEGIELALTGRGLNCQLQLQLKWPNDVMLEGKKVSGVLVEKRQRAGKHVLVLGLGVNVNTHPADTDVSAPATSLAEHLGEQLDRIPIVRAILRRLDVWVMEFVREPQTASDRLQKLWNRRCGMINQRHTVISRGRRHTGRVIAIDPLEGLTLLTDSNLSVRVHAQETTIL